MTNDQATQILRDCGGAFQTINGIPDWRGGLLLMDGVFSADELRALLWFAERGGVET